MIFDKEYRLSTHIWFDHYGIIFTSDIMKAIEQRFKKHKVKGTIEVDYQNAAALFVNLREIKEIPHVSGWLLFDMKHIDSGVIAHECLHATCNLLKSKSFTLTEDSEEAYTYTQQYFITKVSEFYKLALKKYKAK